MVLEELGYIVINPCILPENLTYEQHMKIDLCFVETADVICMLPDWTKSPGAKIEKYHAGEEKKRIIRYAELDKDYYEASKKRLNDFMAQGRLFDD